MTVRFGHTADVHWSEKMPLGDEIVLDPSTDRNVRLADVSRCFDSFVDQAVAFGAQFFLIAGDVFDRARPTPNELDAANASIDRAAEHGPVLVIPGNHDHDNTASNATAVAELA